MVTCPICRMLGKILEVAIHIEQKHDWPYLKVIDWMRDKEEQRV